MHTRQPCTYILASKPYGTLYIGVTSNLHKRVWEHKNDQVVSFTSKYKVHDLVWYELHDDMQSAISHEKQLKNWKREWKLKLINNRNPDWHDLYHGL